MEIKGEGSGKLTDSPIPAVGGSIDRASLELLWWCRGFGLGENRTARRGRGKSGKGGGEGVFQL